MKENVLKTSETTLAEVIDVRDNGLYLRADGRDGFINVTELTWAPGPVVPSCFAKVGDTIAVHVYAVTESAFYASLKALNPQGDPFRDLSIYSEGAVHRGHVWAIRAYGVHVLLESGAIGLLPSQTQTHAPRIGDPVEVEVVSFDATMRQLVIRVVGASATK